VVLGDDLGGDALEVLDHGSQLPPAHPPAAGGVADEVGEADRELAPVPVPGRGEDPVGVRGEVAAPDVVLHVPELRQQGTGRLHRVLR
jgi:hypothetical protein